MKNKGRKKSEEDLLRETSTDSRRNDRRENDTADVFKNAFIDHQHAPLLWFRSTQTVPREFVKRKGIAVREGSTLLTYIYWKVRQPDLWLMHRVSFDRGTCLHQTQPPLFAVETAIGCGCNHRTSEHEIRWPTEDRDQLTYRVLIFNHPCAKSTHDILLREIQQFFVTECLQEESCDRPVQRQTTEVER